MPPTHASKLKGLDLLHLELQYKGHLALLVEDIKKAGSCNVKSTDMFQTSTFRKNTDYTTTVQQKGCSLASMKMLKK